jgi:hypothetical protein
VKRIGQIRTKLLGVCCNPSQDVGNIASFISLAATWKIFSMSTSLLENHAMRGFIKVVYQS